MKSVSDSMPSWSQPAPVTEPKKCICKKDNCEHMIANEKQFRTCSCHLVEGEWGQTGWHFTMLPNGTPIAFARCPAFWAAIERKLDNPNVRYEIDGVRVRRIEVNQASNKHAALMNQRANRR